MPCVSRAWCVEVPQDRNRFEMRRMRSRLKSHNMLARRRSTLQVLERKNLLAGDSMVMVDFAVVSNATVPDDVEHDRRATLPTSMERTHEWDRFAVEIWVHGEGDTPIDIQDLTLDLSYRTDLTSAALVEFGNAFEGANSYTIDDASGTIERIHGETVGVTLGADDRRFVRPSLLPGHSAKRRQRTSRPSNG